MSERARRAAQCRRSLDHWKSILLGALDMGRPILSCKGALEYGKRIPRNALVLRHDIDENPVKAFTMARAEAEVGVSSSYFIRLHSNNYNGMGHESMAILRDLVAMGHEIGLHAEPVDAFTSAGLAPEAGLRIGLDFLSEMAGGAVGIASHGDITPENNLDYLDNIDVREFGALYEAYDSRHLNLFSSSRYISDGHIWRWRTFVDGEPIDDDRCVHAQLGESQLPLYVLVHPHLWFSKHAEISYR